MSSIDEPRTSPWVARGCPDCRGELDGGPVRYYCRPCARSWYAADLNHEVTLAAA
ncbi:MAG TPA: hypothetical protein VH912_22660 [Streptosporangiaceae bacterium]